ncbi:GNAT family N-acetyltransferase [Microlunatus elymi]|uniref:GNAT family N-acetyltransferase n=1 Tax=Microlunatus elymi TaxID=2596828 RepID=UPI00143DC5F3|nr:GNAT family N-acetyltransferase [Microlunatus elymi]
MTNHDIAITDFGRDPDPAAVLDFLTEWVAGSNGVAEQHVADHADGAGTTLTARLDGTVVGLVTLRWTSNNPDFAAHNIPLVHQLMVVPGHRRTGIGTALLDAAERLAADRGRTTVGITVGLFDQYGPAQRLYAKRGYVPDGKGACRARTPLCEGEIVTVDHSLILWLTKDLKQLPSNRNRGEVGVR